MSEAYNVNYFVVGAESQSAQTCPTCGSSIKTAHTSPWECITALKQRLVAFARELDTLKRLQSQGSLGARDRLRRMIIEAKRQGVGQVLNPGDLEYWEHTLARWEAWGL